MIDILHQDINPELKLLTIDNGRWWDLLVVVSKENYLQLTQELTKHLGTDKLPRLAKKIKKLNLIFPIFLFYFIAKEDSQAKQKEILSRYKKMFLLHS